MEANNMAAMREALKAVRDAHFVREENGEECEGFDVEADDGTGRPLICVVEDALSAPPRNCDVGTVQEQGVRFNAFCKKDCDRCSACPKATKYGIETPCYLIWAQMPYETEQKGETNGSK